MADRLIRIGDLAAALAAAAGVAVDGRVRVTEVRLAIPAFVGAVPSGDALWAMTLRRPPRSRFRCLAGLRRWCRRRVGRSPGVLSLRWTPVGLDAALDGRWIARLPDFTRLDFTMPSFTMEEDR